MPHTRASTGKRLLSGGLIFLFLAVLGWREWSLSADGKLHVQFLDVGQGDSALIVTPSGKRVLIDAGPDWSALSRLGERLPFFDRHIDLVVLTHPHLDHLAAFPEIFRRHRVGSLLMAGTPYALGRYQAMLEDAGDAGIAVLGPDTREVVLESGAVLRVLWPPANTFGATVNNVNHASVVAMLEYGGRRVLFTGDIEEETERELVLRGADLRADILKVAHHGSRGSSGEAFLRAVGAGTAVISSGSGNTYGHPRPEALERLTSAGMRIRRTDLEGTIAVVWD